MQPNLESSNTLFVISVFCPFPGFVENGKVLLVGSMGLYEYRPYVRKIRNNRPLHGKLILYGESSHTNRAATNRT